MTDDLERLEALARTCMKPHGYMTAEVFIAAANPSTILSLIQRVREADSDRELFATPVAILQERARKEALEEAARLVDTWATKLIPNEEWMDARRAGREEARVEFSRAIRALGEKAG